MNNASFPEAVKAGPVRIGILSDPRNDAIVDDYYALLKESIFARNPCLRASIPPQQPQRITAALMQCDVALAQFGIPGVDDYQRYLNGFLDGYAAATRKPYTGLVTHDGAHTQHVLDQWLKNGGYDLPEGALTIIDVRSKFNVAILEKALQAIMSNAPSLNTPQLHAHPLNRVDVDSLLYASKPDAKAVP